MSATQASVSSSGIGKDIERVSSSSSLGFLFCFSFLVEILILLLKTCSSGFLFGSPSLESSEISEILTIVAARNKGNRA